jgi:hypothetical protein
MNEILNLSEIEIAWLAGLFEGEANFGLDRRSKTRYINSTSPPLPFIKIAMVDEDIISRVAKLLNKKYFSPSRLTKTGKKVLICHIGDRETLIFLLPRFLPYMGKRRTEKIKECVIELENWKTWIEKKKKKIFNFTSFIFIGNLYYLSFIFIKKNIKYDNT